MDKLFFVTDKVVLNRLNLPVFEQAGVELAVLRLDKTDYLISGNKWFKLQYHLHQAIDQKAKGLVSVGGAHSNHLHALAAAGQRLGFKTVGLIRGNPIQTPTVIDLQNLGMELHWLSYGEFRRRYQDAFWQEWVQRYPDYYFVPEGGGGLLGAKGCQVIPKMIKQQLATIGWDDFDSIYVSVGTGSTLVGIIWGKENRHQVVGCLAVPDCYHVDKQIENLLDEIPIKIANYQLQSAARKGFGQADRELLDFINEVEKTTGLPLDPVYTGKTLFFLQQQVQAGLIAKGTRIVFIHTGGLQGRRVLLDS
ncbi:1-aminocyclopropane-1-carboxylate deaminase/D-cysteine desulfhydrase [Entomomonas asaccharolytica]|uniref:Pyridoxal-phosphate dependent enzyme n=1 Tax=Entomomonas asaccharolytica TaxID=2785331 RepID=A0A974NE95_9GAMM|nr:pyridoxal-phosphate dependent enzyme [Entomomonas asaccharolytica]QQP84989.1 pyridoxal-phosphate dependent enzyme [Entomomonas asaccharolytica]